MAGISIHPQVLDLLKNKASMEEIIVAFEAHHQDENLDMEILLCYGVHYQHEDFLRDWQLLPYSEYSPFTTAVYDQNETMVKILKKKGTTRNSARDFDDEKYGKIVNSQILTDEKTTVWDIIFKRDDIRMFRCLQDHYDCFFIDAQEFPLLCMAKRYNAKECIRFIQNYESADSNKTPNHLFKIAIASSCSFVSSVSPVHRERAVRLWAYLENIATTPPLEKQFMTPDDERLVRQLLAYDNKIKEYCRQDANPSPLQPQVDFTALDVSTLDLAALDLHSRIVLECCHTLVMAYLVPVPETMLYGLMGRIFFSHKQVLYNQGRMLSCQRNMVLVNVIAKLCLQGTVGFEEKTSSTNDDIFKFCWVALNDCQGAAEILRHAHKFIMILLAYGYIQLTQRICDNLFEIKSNRAVGTYNICVGMLPHTTFEAYRLKIQAKEDKLQKATNNTVDNQDSSKFEHFKKIFESRHLLSGSRSLKDLTRIKLYECTPKGKIPALVHKLNISKELKVYLSLNVEPLL